jgi:hypothetical protein
MINNITELYSFVDNFLKLFIRTKKGSRLYNTYWLNKKGREKTLTLAEIVTLNILRYFYHVVDLKAFHKYIKNDLDKYFKKVPNYENFLKATNRSLIFILCVLTYLLRMNSLNGGKYHFIDSTDIPVCKNHYIYSHKVTKSISSRGKTSKGWFYGIKLHGVCNIFGQLENIYFTTGSVHDNQVLNELLNGLEGIFVSDSGYLLKEEDLREFIKLEKQFFTATRKNMKRIMTKEQQTLFKKRSRIETNWNVLKERFNLAYSFARSIIGLLRHYIYCIVSFMLKDCKMEPFILK